MAYSERTSVPRGATWGLGLSHGSLEFPPGSRGLNRLAIPQLLWAQAVAVWSDRDAVEPPLIHPGQDQGEAQGPQQKVILSSCASPVPALAQAPGSCSCRLSNFLDHPVCAESVNGFGFLKCTLHRSRAANTQKSVKQVKPLSWPLWAQDLESDSRGWNPGSVFAPCGTLLFKVLVSFLICEIILSNM